MEQSEIMALKLSSGLRKRLMEGASLPDLMKNGHINIVANTNFEELEIKNLPVGEWVEICGMLLKLETPPDIPIYWEEEVTPQ